MIERERRRKSLGDNLRKFRRKDTIASGIAKSYSSPRKARHFLSGSEDRRPSPLCDVSIPDLLHMAENELRNTPLRNLRASTPCSTGSRAPSVMPSTPSTSASASMHPEAVGERDWLKADWKKLDSCFTDERYQVANMTGLPLGSLASVDDVVDANVVERFTDEMGGNLVLEKLGAAFALYVPFRFFLS